MGFGRSLARASTHSRDNDSAFSAAARWINTHGHADQTWKFVDSSVVELHDGPQGPRHLLQVLGHNLLPVREAGHVAADLGPCIVRDMRIIVTREMEGFPAGLLPLGCR